MNTIEEKIQRIVQLYRRQGLTESEVVAEFVDKVVDNHVCEQSKSLAQILPESVIPALHEFLVKLKDSGFLRELFLIDSPLSITEEQEWMHSLRDEYRRVYEELEE